MSKLGVQLQGAAVILDDAQRYGQAQSAAVRFIPIIRTFAPFVAGIDAMSYGRFLSYNIFGGILWVTIFTLGGYFFGNLPFVKENFAVVVVAIILISVLPMIMVEFVRTKMLIASD